MSKEYIEKEAAIRNFCKGCGLFDTDNCICTGKVRCDEYDAIRDTPPADVAPIVKGEWMEHIEEYPDGSVAMVDWYCSICKEYGYNDYNFCPNCGAAMTAAAVSMLRGRSEGNG